jgi:hypothetical protein
MNSDESQLQNASENRTPDDHQVGTAHQFVECQSRNETGPSPGCWGESEATTTRAVRESRQVSNRISSYKKERKMIFRRNSNFTGWGDGASQKISSPTASLLGRCINHLRPTGRCTGPVWHVTNALWTDTHHLSGYLENIPVKRAAMWRVEVAINFHSAEC